MTGSTPDSGGSNMVTGLNGPPGSKEGGQCTAELSSVHFFLKKNNVCLQRAAVAWGRVRRGW